MKYKIKQETKPTLPTYKKWKAVAVHERTIESAQIVEEVKERGRVFDESIIRPVLMRLSAVVAEHLRRGDRVRLEDWGMLKLEIESEKVDAPDDFKPKQHIRGVRLHFIPESEKGKPQLYQNLSFEKEKR